jgi:hypothetical protein
MALFLVALMTSMQAAGDFAYLSPEDLARQSDLIVVGEFIGRDRVQFSAAGPVLDVGVVRVESVLKGDAGRSIVLLTLPPIRPRGLVGSAEVAPTQGQRGLWYFTRKSDGLYTIDRPDRFVAMADAAARIRALRQAR